MSFILSYLLPLINQPIKHGWTRSEIVSSHNSGSTCTRNLWLRSAGPFRCSGRPSWTPKFIRRSLQGPLTSHGWRNRARWAVSVTQCKHGELCTHVAGFTSRPGPGGLSTAFS
jgi:hypothetical protein